MLKHGFGTEVDERLVAGLVGKKAWTSALVNRGIDHSPELGVRDAHGLRAQGTDREAEVAGTLALTGPHEYGSCIVC